MSVAFPQRRKYNQAAPTTRPLSLFHQHSASITHFASSHAAVNVMQCSKFHKPFSYIMPKRQHTDEGQPCLCMVWHQQTVSNSKSTQSKLCSACNTFKLYSWCENLMQTDHVAKYAVWVPYLCNQPSNLLITNFFSASSLTLAFRDLQLATREVFKITSSSDTTALPACLLHFLCSTLQQLYLHCPIMQHTVTATTLQLNFNNSKHSVYIIYILIHFVFNSHCMCVQVSVL